MKDEFKEQIVVGRLSKQNLQDFLMGAASCDDETKRQLFRWLDIVIEHDCDLIVSAPADNDKYKKVSRP